MKLLNASAMKSESNMAILLCTGILPKMKLGILSTYDYDKQGVKLRRIQVLLGHGSSKTTEIYTHVAISTFNSIKNPLDL